MDDIQKKIVSTVALFFILFFLRWLLKKVILKRLVHAEFSDDRGKIIHKASGLISFLILIVGCSGIWGLDGNEIFAFMTSVLTVLGVGFFAQWSLLSNITSGIVLYFNHPLKLGDNLTIIDGDHKMQGTVTDISLFFLHLKDSNGIEFTLPNSSVIQKTLTINNSNTTDLEEFDKKPDGHDKD